MTVMSVMVAAWMMVSGALVGSAGGVRVDDAMGRLRAAIRVNDASGVTKALKDGADPQAEEGAVSAMLLALVYADAGVLKAMVDAGVDLKDVETEDGDALNTVLQRQTVSVEAVKVVIEAGLKPTDESYEGWTPLLTPAGLANAGVVKVLLEAGCSANPPRDEEGWPLACKAAWRGSPEVVRELVKAKMDVNAAGPEGRRALHMASMRDEEAAGEVVKILTEAGAEVQAADETGWKATYFAALAPSPWAMKALIDAGASAKDEVGGTPLLHYCILGGDVESLKMVLAAGADANAKSAADVTTLEMVVRMAQLTIDEDGWFDDSNPTLFLDRLDKLDVVGQMRALLGAGANPNEVGAAGWTPLMLAAHLWDTERLPTESDETDLINAWAEIQPRLNRFAKTHNPCDLVRLLLDKGAKRLPETVELTELDIAAQRGDGYRGELLRLLRTAPVAEKAGAGK